MKHKRIFFNGRITTLDSQYPQAQAVYVEDGKWSAIGTNEEILLQFGREGVEKIDLQGGYAYPGLVDSHMHLAAHGMKLSVMLDFSHTRSKEEMLSLLREKVAAMPKGAWVLGLNWNENAFPDRAIPSLRELDEIAPEHPVFLTRVCYHAALVNTQAYKRAGIGESTPDPEGGAFGRDASGRLNGLVYDNAIAPFREAQPKPGYREYKEFVRKAMSHALSLGLTAVHTEDLWQFGSVEWMVRAYRELNEEGLFLRAHHLIYHPYLEELDALREEGIREDRWFRIGACKIFADGAFGGRTALLSRPYADDPANSGMAIHSQEELNELTCQARMRKMPVAIHAIGDRAAEMVLTTLETYPIETYAGPTQRDRLIHATLLREDLLERLKARRGQIALDLQPRFVPSDFPWVMERLGQERLRYAYAWKTLIDEGLYCGGGSDAPIEPLEPLLGIHAAVTRRKPEETGFEGFLPEQKLSLLEALRLFTLGSACCAAEEKERGSISIGKWADMSVFDQDLLQEEPDGILEAKTLFTIVNGEIGYQAL